MSQTLEELPLFPLNVVIFPYAALQLHIVEDRYREMVRTCLEFDRPFGIVLIRSGSETGEADPYMVGTVVRITSVHNYDDGRMDIDVQGERRFRIRKLDESHSYLAGYVEPVIEHEIEDSPRANQLISQAKEEFENLMRRFFARQEFNVQVVFPPDPVALSFTIANLLQMDNLEKQRLLETTDTLERFEELIPVLQMQNMDAASPAYYRISSVDLQEWVTAN
ncbi:MAG TPA: LON peptidase substrate-binding domain-containing protein [Fimbriimonadaceae bacterium]|nr:LON peptidase substrate-binding domain-containing protein [Fimbriimonadaceae bacterium]